MKREMRAARRLVPSSRHLGVGLGFIAAPAASIVSPLLVTPIISRKFGAEGVLAISVGQSIGAVLGILVALAFPLTGSSIVARSSFQARPAIYLESLRLRLQVFIFLGPIALVGAALLAQGLPIVSALTALAFAGYGFTSFWFYAGTGRPGGLIKYEVLPRMLAALTAALLLTVGAPLILYPVLLITSVVYAVLQSSRQIAGSLAIWPSAIYWSGLRAQMISTLSRFVNGIYGAGATSIVALANPSILLVFTSYDRLTKTGFNAAGTFTEALISWVAGQPASIAKRQRIALAGDLIYSLLIGVVFYLFLPPVVGFMYADVVPIDEVLRSVSAYALSTLIFSRAAVAHGLLALGLERAASLILIVGSVLGTLALAGTAIASQSPAASIFATGSAELLIALVAVIWTLVHQRSRPGGTNI